MNVAKREVFELQKTCKCLDSNSESQDAKNACGKAVYEEVHCSFTVMVLN
jgi:hypothetical protein